MQNLILERIQYLLHFQFQVLKIKKNRVGLFFQGVITFGRVKILSPKIVITFPGPIRRLIVKENLIGSAFSEILYRQKSLLLYIYHSNKKDIEIF